MKAAYIVMVHVCHMACAIKFHIVHISLPVYRACGESIEMKLMNQTYLLLVQKSPLENFTFNMILVNSFY